MDVNATRGGGHVSENRQYIAIDLKSFYASVECKERGRDPLTTNLVVADASRTNKTICLAVSPSLKAYGIPGRARLFEVVQKVKAVNRERLRYAPNHAFSGESDDDEQIKKDPGLAISYITAPPRMALYMKYSTDIYQIYLKYVAPEDIHVYSIDEVFMDVTHYLNTYHMTASELARKIIQDVQLTTGITATAGIGTNLYLAKIAMDIMAKHIPADSTGVRIARLDEQTYRRFLWDHRPITDFWRVGRGYAKKLEACGLYTMGDVARCSVGKPNEYYNEELLYQMFGVNAQLLIDHAWGYEPTTIQDIRNYRPESRSVGTGQVLQCPYSYEKARLIVQEMTDVLVLDLVDKGLATDQMVLTVGYDIENLKGNKSVGAYSGEVTTDRYGRKVPKHAHGSANLKEPTSSTRKITESVMQLYDDIVDKNLLVRRINLVANHVVKEAELCLTKEYEQLELFTDYEALQEEKKQEQEEQKKEKQMQHAMLDIKKKYGKNAILKGMNLQEGAMTRERNRQIGGHKA